jgi:hypothetical protein
MALHEFEEVSQGLAYLPVPTNQKHEYSWTRLFNACGNDQKTLDTYNCL